MKDYYDFAVGLIMVYSVLALIAFALFAADFYSMIKNPFKRIIFVLPFGPLTWIMVICYHLMNPISDIILFFEKPLSIISKWFLK